MSQWYFAIDGQQTGPFGDPAAIDFARENPNAHCWRPGFADWRVSSEAPEPSGNGASAMSMLAAADGPLFVTVTVYVTSVFASAVAGPVMVTATSACSVTVVVT